MGCTSPPSSDEAAETPEPEATALIHEACLPRATIDFTPGDSATVAETEPLCDLEFREVARLVGQVEGIAPRLPVAVGPNETYITATWNPGQIAVWGADGTLERVFGAGPGEGPGEFSSVSGLLATPDSVVHVLPGRPYWHVYTLGGEFLETLRMPVPGAPARLVIASGPRLVTSVRLFDEGIQILSWKDGDFSLGPTISLGPQRNRRLVLATSPEGHLWSSESDEYVARLHGPSQGEPGFRLRREVAWFPGAGDLPASVFDLAVDQVGIVWVLVGTPAPDAPPGPPPPVQSREELREVASRYRNNVVEALSPDGRLIATKWYEDSKFTPRPLGGDRWYVEGDELLPVITIVTPVLHPRPLN